MKLTDPFGRHINYLRLSVTDRCNYRCVYCMAEDMTFLPRAQVLTLEESAEICHAFAELGVDRIRITGGEPLIRQNIDQLFRSIGKISSLKELTLTTNGAKLAGMAAQLVDSGVKRINVSLDTLDAAQFRALTRSGHIEDVLRGIERAKAAGIERIKLNAVILRNRNLDQVVPLLEYALTHDLDISYIEEMPLGSISDHHRETEFCSSHELLQLIERSYTVTPSAHKTSGPSRYWQVAGATTQVGFISPHSNNFCGECNRVRVTAEGKLLLCLGNEHSLDLKQIIRRYPGERQVLKDAIVSALTQKPERHHFDDPNAPQVVRFMNATGG